MKRVKIWLVTLLTFIVSAFAFTSCEALAGIFGDSIVGTYKMCGIIKRDVTYEIGDEMEGVVLTEDMIKLEIKSDNTFVLKFNNYLGQLTEECEGTWAKDEEDSMDGYTYYRLIIDEDEGAFEIRTNENFFGLRVAQDAFAMLEKQSFLPF